MDSLQYDVVSHAAWTAGMNYGEETKTLGLAAVRYYRFAGVAKLERMRLYPLVLRFATPQSIGQPAHVEVAAFDDNESKWNVIADKRLPLFKDSSPHTIGLKGVSARNIRVVCDKEHPVPLNHMEQWRSPDIVPFRILEKIEFDGEVKDAAITEPDYNPPLKKGDIELSAVAGINVVEEPHQVTYRSPYFSISFSLRRPMIVSMGWDDMGKGLSSDNLIADYSVWKELTYLAHPASAFFKNYYKYAGPSLRALKQDYSAANWSGEVQVSGSTVYYKNISAVGSYALDITFEVHCKGMNVHVVKRCESDLVAFEIDDLQLMWNVMRCITGTIAMPFRENGRAGMASLPAILNAPGHGTVFIHEKNGREDVKLQVDSWREKCVSWIGIALGVERDRYGAAINRKGTYEAHLAFKVQPLMPRTKKSVAVEAIPDGILRNWSTAFSFRPEMGGFSNNSISVNCHVCQYAVADIAAYTKTYEKYPTMIELLRYTVELALRGGPGYADCRELYIDSDPSILCTVGRVQQVGPDTLWIAKMWPFIKETCERMLDNVDDNGLLVCRSLTGNSGSKKWSSNTWDVISFGHHDAYSNALAYRAIKNMISVAAAAGDAGVSEKCRNAAAKLKNAYRDCFYNPDTGWLAGWRSADGNLHDYAFTFINYLAICYGLIEGDEAKNIILRLEKKMEECGLTYFYYGIPPNLIPVKSQDAPAGQDSKRSDGWDTYGIYINGCLTTSFMQYYLRALSMYGFREKADLICEHLEQSFGSNRIIGGVGSGKEFATWEGRACGYEGILVYQFPVIAAIAQHRGIVETLDPEWWI